MLVILSSYLMEKSEHTLRISWHDDASTTQKKKKGKPHKMMKMKIDADDSHGYTINSRLTMAIPQPT